MNEIDAIVTLHFTCGKTMRVSYSKEKLDKFLETLSRGWGAGYIVGDKFGVNFAQVCYYEIEEVKE